MIGGCNGMPEVQEESYSHDGGSTVPRWALRFVLGGQDNARETREVDARLVPLAETPQLAEGDTASAGAGEPEHDSLDGGAVDGAWATGTQDVAVDIGKDGGGAVLPYVTAPNNIEGIICDRFDDCDYWIAVAFCESSMHPDAVGYGGAYVGLFQVWLGHGYGYDWLLDPWNNALAAWELSREGTVTSPWPYCRWAR